MKGKGRGSVERAPVAPVTLREMPGTRVLLWVVDPCPYCAGTHFHPAGRGDLAEAQLRLGEVPAACDAGRLYTLQVPPKPKRTRGKEERRRARREARRKMDDDSDDW
ncbi:hypothetical protein [Deinococcus maricopensis]|uniref:Uncharacterized protein n=1 Tax=Deinococcus maricopensis (strain DSM 21211 / LMG 22137 / NRRL B-23946 / LB-34) TaxID=709986 RepID=E8U5W9_DEIML|nr:hypothetical protein [Deinococcus maricopensis]ADV66458.1 hypothetical protein Deima_0803 [Deinococcus maricopensis DSM 21211]